MGAAYYITLIVFGIIGLISIIIKISVQGKTELLDEMFKNDDVSSEVYKKYKSKI